MNSSTWTERRKFLKSNSTETNNIIAAFERIALVYPQLAFTLSTNGVETFCLRPGNTRQRGVAAAGQYDGAALLSAVKCPIACPVAMWYNTPWNPKKENKKAEYSIMLMDGTLNSHLKEIQETAIERVEKIIKQLKENILHLCMVL